MPSAIEAPSVMGRIVRGNGNGEATRTHRKERIMIDASCFHNLKSGGIERQLAPGVNARVFPGVHAMLSVVTLEPGAVSPVHAHPNEQWSVCLEGEWIRVQDGFEHHVTAGDFRQTPPNVPHGGRALAVRCVVLDIFAPPREEYRRPGAGLGAATLA